MPDTPEDAPPPSLLVVPGSVAEPVVREHFLPEPKVVTGKAHAVIDVHRPATDEED